MVPALFLPLETLPLSANGKLDRKALPRPTWQGEEAPGAARRAGRAGAGRTRSEVLGVPLAQLGRQSNFFALGGHSLLATVLLARMRETFPRPPSRAPCSSSRPWQRSRPGPESPAQALPTIVPGPRPARLPLSPAQQRLWFLSAARARERGVQHRGRCRAARALQPAWLRAALNEIVARHEVLRSRIVSASEDAVQLVLDASVELSLPVDTVTAVDEARGRPPCRSTPAARPPCRRRTHDRCPRPPDPPGRRCAGAAPLTREITALPMMVAPAPHR